MTRREPHLWRARAAVELDRLGMLSVSAHVRAVLGGRSGDRGRCVVRTIMFTDLVGLDLELNVRTRRYRVSSICSTGTTRSCVGAFDSLMVSS